MKRLLLSFALSLIGFFAQAGGGIPTDPSPYCADTSSNTDSVFLAGASFANNIDIPALNGYPYALGDFVFISGVQGQTITAQLYMSDANGISWAMWADFNHDDMFSDDELVDSASNLAANAIDTASIFLPLTALTGATRVRLRVTTDTTVLTPCDDYQTGNTADFILIINPGAAPYCDGISGAGSADGDYIAHVVMDSIDYEFTDMTGVGYLYETDYTTTLQAGGSYQIFLTNGMYYECVISAWIDYNRNLQFDDNEKISSDYFYMPDSSFQSNFTVPANADTGLTRMRVRQKYTEGKDEVGPCEWVEYGLTLDFPVTIQPAPVSAVAEPTHGRAFIYPNPATTAINVVAPWQQGNYRLYYTDGSMVLQSTFSQNEFRLYTSLLPNGVYRLEIQHEDARQVLNFQKQ